MARDSRSLVLVVVLALVGVGDSSANQTENQAGEASTTEKTCFRVRDTRGFSAIDDRFVYVKSVRNKHYLLTLENRCYGLEYAIKIGIANEFDRVCSNDRAVLTYRDFNRLRRCEILNVEAVAGLEVAERVVEDRTTPRAKAKKKDRTESDP